MGALVAAFARADVGLSRQTVDRYMVACTDRGLRMASLIDIAVDRDAGGDAATRCIVERVERAYGPARSTSSS